MRLRYLREVAVAFLWLGRIEVTLRRRNLPALCASLGIALDLDSAAPPATEPAVLPGRARTVLRACTAATRRWPAGDTCLRQCLVVGRRLRHLAPVLRIGVRREGSAIVAHSWLEIDGCTLDPSSAGYATLGR